MGFAQMTTPATLNFAAHGTTAIYPLFTNDGSGNLMASGVAPVIGMLVELRLLSTFLNTSGLDLAPMRADELAEILVGGKGSL
jgi:hypothetical protein